MLLRDDTRSKITAGTMRTATALTILFLAAILEAGGVFNYARQVGMLKS